MKRDILWRKAKQTRFFYSLLTAAICTIITACIGDGWSSSMYIIGIPTSVVWGILSFKVDELKPMYLRRDE